MTDALRQVQKHFAAALREAADESLLADLGGDAALNRERIAVYRGNLIANRGHALALAFPVVLQIVGAEFFDGLSRAYRHAQPSRSGNLDLLGEAFPAFLAGFEPAQALPYLAEVAALEWAVACAARAADHTPMTLAGLVSLSPEGLESQGVELQPALWLHASPWPLATIWHLHQPDCPREFTVDLDQAEAVLVWRDGLRPQVAVLSAGEWALWSALQAGAALGAALAAALDADPRLDPAAALQSGFTRGLVTALATPPSKGQ